MMNKKAMLFIGTGSAMCLDLSQEAVDGGLQIAQYITRQLLL